MSTVVLIVLLAAYVAIAAVAGGMLIVLLRITAQILFGWCRCSMTCFRSVAPNCKHSYCGSHCVTTCGCLSRQYGTVTLSLHR